MKSSILIFLGMTMLALSGICLFQGHKLAEQRTELGRLRAESLEQAQQVEDLTTAQKRSEGERRELLEQTEQLAAELQARRAAESKVVTPANLAPTPAPTRTNPPSAGFGGMLAKMMQDPETKNFLREQQRMMMDQLYGPLIKQLGLNPDEAAKFKELLADNMLKGTEQAGSLLSGSSDTNRAAALASIADQQKSFNDQLKALLGDDRFAQYKDYQQTAGERTQLNLFKAQLGSDNALTDQQAEQLLTFMKEEKQALAANGQTLPGTGQDDSNLQNLQAMFSGDQADKMMQTQETMNQQVYERARTILSPEQLDAFGRFQASQAQMMRMGMSMARKMFTPDNAPSGTSGP